MDKGVDELLRDLGPWSYPFKSSFLGAINMPLIYRCHLGARPWLHALS